MFEKIFLFFFQKPLDKSPKVWYNKYRKKERENKKRMKFYDYTVKNENGTWGKMLTEDETKVLLDAINNEGGVGAKFTITKVDVKNGIIYGTRVYRNNY